VRRARRPGNGAGCARRSTAARSRDQNVRGGALIDGLPTTYADAIGANRPNDARRGVDRLVNAGTDFVKVYTRMDPALLGAALDEARTFNLRVSGHLGLTDAVTAARAALPPSST
jgi:hypothetical protein